MLTMNFLKDVLTIGNEMNSCIFCKQQFVKILDNLFFIHGNTYITSYILHYFLDTILCPEHTNLLKTITDRSIHHWCQGGLSDF